MHRLHCREDTALAEKLPDPSQSKVFFRNIASAAESGWDFSSRWCGDAQNLATIRTTEIVPIDLNVYMWTMEDVARKLSLSVQDEDAAMVVRHVTPGIACLLSMH